MAIKRTFERGMWCPYFFPSEIIRRMVLVLRLYFLESCSSTSLLDSPFSLESESSTQMLMLRNMVLYCLLADPGAKPFNPRASFSLRFCPSKCFDIESKYVRTSSGIGFFDFEQVDKGPIVKADSLFFCITFCRNLGSSSRDLQPLFGNWFVYSS